MDDFDFLTVEDIMALTGIEDVDYDDYMEAFGDEDIPESDFSFILVIAESDNDDLPF